MRILRCIEWGTAVAGLASIIVFGVWMGTGFFANWQREVLITCPHAEPTPVFVEVRQVSARSIHVRVSNRSTSPLAISKKIEDNPIPVSVSLFYRSLADLGIPVDDRPDEATRPMVVFPGESIEREVNLAMLVEKQARDNHGEIIYVVSGGRRLNPLANFPFKAQVSIGLNTDLCGVVELLPPTQITIAMPNTCQFDEECAKNGRSFLSWVYVASLGLTNLTYEDEDAAVPN